MWHGTWYISSVYDALGISPRIIFFAAAKTVRLYSRRETALRQAGDQLARVRACEENWRRQSVPRARGDEPHHLVCRRGGPCVFCSAGLPSGLRVHPVKQRPEETDDDHGLKTECAKRPFK